MAPEVASFEPGQHEEEVIPMDEALADLEQEVEKDREEVLRNTLDPEIYNSYQTNPDAFLAALKKLDTHHSSAIPGLIKENLSLFRQLSPIQKLKFVEDIEDMPFYDEVVEEVANYYSENDPWMLLQVSHLIKNKPYAEEMIRQATKERPSTMLTFMNRLDGMDYADNILREAITGSMQQDPLALLEGYDKYKHLSDADGILERASVKLAEVNPEKLLENQELIADYPFAEEVLQLANQNKERYKAQGAPEAKTKIAVPPEIDEMLQNPRFKEWAENTKFKKGLAYLQQNGIRLSSQLIAALGVEKGTDPQYLDALVYLRATGLQIEPRLVWNLAKKQAHNKEYLSLLARFNDQFYSADMADIVQQYPTVANLQNGIEGRIH